MTARNAIDDDRSDRIRLIREQAADVCCRKNRRLWWTVAIIIGVLGTVSKLGYEAYGMVRENAINVRALEKQTDILRAGIDRIDAKLDRLLSRK